LAEGENAGFLAAEAGDFEAVSVQTGDCEDILLRFNHPVEGGVVEPAGFSAGAAVVVAVELRARELFKEAAERSCVRGRMGFIGRNGMMAFLGVARARVGLWWWPLFHLRYFHRGLQLQLQRAHAGHTQAGAQNP